MRILAIDTVTEMCSVALWVEGALTTRQELAAQRHSNIVLGMVDELLLESKVALSDIDLIVADVGPGSFTGIRIGMGVAQGLAYGADIPILAVDALSLLAQSVAKDNDKDVLAAIDARMGQVYWAHYVRQADGLKLSDELHLSNPEEINLAEENVLGLGSGIDAYTDEISSRCQQLEIVEKQFPLAQYAISIALEASKSEWQSAGELMPIYLRNDVAKVSQKAVKHLDPT